MMYFAYTPAGRGGDQTCDCLYPRQICNLLHYIAELGEK